MMLKPYMNDLLKKVDNRYLLVNVAAKRARDVATEYQEEGIEMVKKPVRIALEEIYDGVVVPLSEEEMNERQREICELNEKDVRDDFSYAQEDQNQDNEDE